MMDAQNIDKVQCIVRATCRAIFRQDGIANTCLTFVCHVPVLRWSRQQFCGPTTDAAIKVLPQSMNTCMFD
jgi:hypothetical protein